MSRTDNMPELECRHLVNPNHEHAPCSTCDAPAFYQDMGFFFHCDDGTSSQSWCERPKPRRRWWQRGVRVDRDKSIRGRKIK